MQSLYAVSSVLDVAKLLNVEQNKVLFTFLGHKGPVYGAHFHPRK